MQDSTQAALEHWQPVLPMPFRIIDELLGELIDATVLQATLVGAARDQQRKVAPTPDAETDYTDVCAERYMVAPAALGDLSRALVMQLSDSVMVVASAASEVTASKLWLWEHGREPQELLALAGGVAPRSITAVPVGAMGAASIADGSETRRVLLIASSSTGSASLHVIDVTPGDSQGPWAVTPQAALAVNTDHPLSARVSEDGRLLACPYTNTGEGTLNTGGGDELLHIYALPPAAKLRAPDAPPPPAPPTLALAYTMPLPAIPAGAAFSEMIPEGGFAPEISFLLAPRARELSEPLSWRACGLTFWTSQVPQLLQVRTSDLCKYV